MSLAKDQKSLFTLAKKMQILKKQDKLTLLKRFQKCAVLFHPKTPQSIDECPVNERLGYKIDLIRFLYRKLTGEQYTTYLPAAHDWGNAEELKQMVKKEIQQKMVCDGLSAYCNASDSDKIAFEKSVKKFRLLAPLLRRKDKILDYCFN